jgi:predicted glycoside hydrolase/deacetylase ChbG (UPF0249 family)
MRVLYHADDLGLTAGITRRIMECQDGGALSGASLIVNGADVEGAARAVRKVPQFRVVLHLNLFEGPALCPPGDVDLLVDADGHFNRGFIGLWQIYQTAGAAKRARLREQVRREICRQIERFRELFTDLDGLRVDSHSHFHMIPFVFDQLVDLSDPYGIRHIRLPREPFLVTSSFAWPAFLSLNLAKHKLLNFLAERHGPILAAKGLVSNQYLVGVLYSGQMSVAVVEAALRRLGRLNADGEIELLFHPGGADSDEAAQWAKRPELRAFYLSPARKSEAAALKSPALVRLLADYAAETGDREPAPAPR